MQTQKLLYGRAWNLCIVYIPRSNIHTDQLCMQLHSSCTPQDVAFSDPKNERALGQLLVLLQYKWPKEEEMFASVITTIQKRRKFNFPEFFNYVISILCILYCSIWIWFSKILTVWMVIKKGSVHVACVAGTTVISYNWFFFVQHRNSRWYFNMAQSSVWQCLIELTFDHITH